MRVAIAGGHGKIALHLEKLLADAGHEAIALIRNPEHGADVLVAGGIPAVVDLETTDADALATDLAGVDAVVFAAGAGPGSTAERKNTVDRDGAILLADAAVRAGIRRYVLISAIATDDFDPDSDDVFQVYLRAKSEADADVRGRDLDWTIVRPGGLTDDAPTGRVRLAESTGRGSIPRADVAAIIASALVDGYGIRAQFEAVSGEESVKDALAALRY
ncbi:SDR family oxidoreductase [Glaciibacter superstes]|uniref:SDR family oxidoreductase n=1 Tax=Glaciibacter superstes TaxID=501023 RepID=UPI0003B34D96|nr:SDR family oxidoreductase [Glaciibacter superstes]